VRCGSALVPQTSSKEKEKPKSSDIEFNLPPSEPDGLEATFGPTFQPELKTKDSDRGPGAAPSQSSPSGPKGQDVGVTERGKKREFRAAPAPELSLEEQFLQAQTPEQPVAKRSANDLLKGLTFLSKFKKDYRRLGIEVGSIMIMVLAGGYLLWSVYSYFTKPKPSEPGAPVSKNVAIQSLPNSSSSTPPAAPVVESRESKSTEGSPSISSSSISKEAAPAPPPLPDTSGTPSTEIREIGNIKIVLENIRRANLHEDIDLFLHCYASDFRNREEKRKATLANWKIFNYHDLSYDLKKTSISDNTAKARVEWVIKTSSKEGGRRQENKSILDVTFKKEEGRWKIEEVTPAR
jgi:ketosteroid isomerase-like protein